nr:GIY-YIG nuclease family protein [cf. Phormidesmis sp. LEGE 11477]
MSERNQLPERSAIYFAVSCSQVLYVGLATNIKRRWQNHHRYKQLELIDRKADVTLFWLTCPQHQLQELERQYIEYYCPTLNQTKLPNRPLIPSSQMLSRSLKKLNSRLLGFGVCPAQDHGLTVLLVAYLASHQELRLATTSVRRTLKAISNKPDSLFRWTETTRRKTGAHWRTRCNGIEVRLFPWSEERIMHNPSMYEVMSGPLFGTRRSIPMAEYKDMRQQVKEMPFTERLELARRSKIGLQLFPLECGAHFVSIHQVDILCLTEQQLRELFSKRSFLRKYYPTIQAIKHDPLPVLQF